jgi:hypothetical protein
MEFQIALIRITPFPATAFLSAERERVFTLPLIVEFPRSDFLLEGFTFLLTSWYANPIDEY